MSLPFAITPFLIAFSAVAAMSLRNLVHCALCLMVTFAGLAALFLQLNAQFVGFAQILVYIGAVAILIVFAILLTRSSETTPHAILSPSWFGGIAVALVVFAVLAVTIFRSSITDRNLAAAPQVSVRQLGEQLMTKYLLPL